MLRTVLFLLVGSMLVSCATSTLSSKEKTAAFNAYITEHNLKQVDKIRPFRIDQWTGLGKQHLILYRRFNEPYLITLKSRCFDLEHAVAISVNHNHGSLLAKFDSITVPNDIQVNCYIKSIHRLTKAQKKELLAIGKPPEGKTES